MTDKEYKNMSIADIIKKELREIEYQKHTGTLLSIVDMIENKEPDIRGYIVVNGIKVVYVKVKNQKCVILNYENVTTYIQYTNLDKLRIHLMTTEKEIIDKYFIKYP